MTQLQLIPFEYMSPERMKQVTNQLRSEYWFIRTVRSATNRGVAVRRKHYRRVVKLKSELLLAGIEKRTLLDLLACCRLTCPAKKQPFLPCPYCTPK